MKGRTIFIVAVPKNFGHIESGLWLEWPLREGLLYCHIGMKYIVLITTAMKWMQHACSSVGGLLGSKNLAKFFCENKQVE